MAIDWKKTLDYRRPSFREMLKTSRKIRGWTYRANPNTITISK